MNRCKSCALDLSYHLNKPDQCDECQEAGLKDYSKNQAYVRFVIAMRAAGLEPYHYNGRWFYSGPAVNVDSIQDAVRHTSVSCTSDNMGLGYVVYPKG